MQRSAAAVTLDEISRSYAEQEALVRLYSDSLTILEGAAALKSYAILETETDYLNLIRGRHIEALALSRQTMPYTLVVDAAVVAEKKVFPRRTVIVIVSTVSVLILMALILFVAEGVKLHRGDDRQ
jgi:hypothetical protein